MKNEQLILTLIKSLAGNSSNESTSDQWVDHGYRCVVMDKGFTYFGNLKISDSEILITDAKNLRKHRTGQGLGYAAMHPEHNEVTLDNSPDIRAPISSLILHMEAKRA